MGVLNPAAMSHYVNNEDESLHIGPSSIDLHIAPEKTVFERSTDVIDVTDESTYPETRTVETDVITLQPAEFCLARSKEKVDLSHGKGALVHGRSSIGRLGLFVENAGLIDRGFEGTITLELFNASTRVIEVPAGTRVAQLLFFSQAGDEDTAYDGKYNGQVEPTASRLYDDEDVGNGS
jgi:dCTP deaminase